MKEIKKSANIKSKVKGKDVKFNIDLNYSPEYDSFNIKVKKGEGFMSYTDALQGLPLDVVQNLNEMLEEVLIKSGSKTEMKEHKMSNGGDFQSGVYAKGGSLIGNQKSIDMNHNGKIDAEDFKLLRTTMNGAWRNEHEHINSSDPKQDYEVRYARKNKSDRTGYKGKTNFAYGGGVNRFSEYSNDALYDMIINLSRYENTESEIQMVKAELEKRKRQNSDIQQEIDLTDDKKLRLRKPVMPEKRLSQKEWAEKFNPRAYEFMGKRNFADGGSLNLDFRNFTLDELIKKLPQDVQFISILKNNSKDRIRIGDKEFKNYKFKHWTITDYGSMELSRGSENLYLDMKVYEASKEAPDVEYTISLFTKDNQKGLKELANNLVEKFAKGGKTEEGVDLFEDYENIPPKLQAILEKYEDAFENGDYRGLQKALEEANKIGYTFEYYLDGQAYDLRKIGEKGKSEVEEYAKGGGVEKLSFEDWLKKNNIEVYKRTYYWVADDGGNDYMYSGSKGDVMKYLREDYKKSFANGGAFEKLSNRVAKNYEGKRVKPQYQKEYGKVYSKSEAKEVGDKVAGKVKANQKMASGGEFPDYGEIVQGEDIDYDMKSYFNRTNKKLIITTKDKKQHSNGAVTKYYNDLIFVAKDKWDIPVKDILNVEILKEKMAFGGETKKGARGGIMTLAKKIRKDGEKWTDAVKRAGQQLK